MYPHKFKYLWYYLCILPDIESGIYSFISSSSLYIQQYFNTAILFGISPILKILSLYFEILCQMMRSFSPQINNIVAHKFIHIKG